MIAHEIQTCTQIDSKLPTDPSARYFVTIGLPGISGRRIETTYRTLAKVSTYFGLEDPIDLIGQIFEAPDRQQLPQHAWTWLVFKVEQEELFTQAAKELAEMRCPVYPRSQADAVFEAFLRVFRDQEWFQTFQERVEAFSRMQVRIEFANMEEFHSAIRGPAKYLYLVRGTERKRMTFCPAYPPFEFDE